MNLKHFFSSLGQRNSSMIPSYKALRRLIGVLGILLPFLCVLGGLCFTALPAQESISIYYYTNMRDFFVGIMFIVSIFLITYKGYSISDHILTTITGVFGLGIAVFPCYSVLFEKQKVGIFQMYPSASDWFHSSCAGIFFVLLAFNAIFMFTKTGLQGMTARKRIRNRIYIVSGILILFSVLGIFFSRLLLSAGEQYRFKLILICEIIALISFGTSWLVKGKTLCADKRE
jgi:hypothetical protein